MNAIIHINIKHVPAVKDGFTETREHFIAESSTMFSLRGEVKTGPAIKMAATSIGEAKRQLCEEFAKANSTEADALAYYDVEIGRILNIADLPEPLHTELIDGDWKTALDKEKSLKADAIRKQKQTDFTTACTVHDIPAAASVGLDWDGEVAEMYGVARYNQYTHKREKAIANTRYRRLKGGEFNWKKMKEDVDRKVSYLEREKKEAAAAKQVRMDAEAACEHLGLSKYDDKVKVSTEGKVILTVSFASEKLDEVVAALAAVGVQIKK